MLLKLLLITFCFLLTANSFAQFNPNLTYGEVKDVDGNKYKTIQIGKETWMAENLRTTKYNDGSIIPVVSDSTDWADNWIYSTTLPMMCWYNNDQATYTANKFGALYNWYAINLATNGNKNVCPSGWHVPTDAEWDTLEQFASRKGFFEGNVFTSISGWGKPAGAGAIGHRRGMNESGFSGLPAGSREIWNYYGAGFTGVGRYGCWWSSTRSSDYYVWIRSLTYAEFPKEFFYKEPQFQMHRGDRVEAGNGFSVRCIKD